MSCVVNLHHLNFRYPGEHEDILNNLSLCIHKGETIALLGRNGSGKSTLMKLLAYQLPLPKGTNTLPNFHDVTLLSQHMEKDLFIDLTLEENLHLFELEFPSHQARDNYLSSYHPQLPQRLKVPLKKLSGGEKQAFLLSLTLYHLPSLVLMDEPTSAMDIWAQDKLMTRAVQKTQQTGATLLICTHSLEVAQRHTKRFIALKKGQIVLDRPSKPPLTHAEIEMIYA